MTPFDDAPPDHVNELCVKWWRDTGITEYARRADAHGTSLDATGYYVEQPSGRRTRVLVVDGALMMESQSLEAIATKIDLLKYLRRQEPDTQSGERSTERQANQQVTRRPRKAGR